ncbi:unnamed protein product [Parascedosporium putredinis]|uniref:Uncharacterized protein n=1 Tax=Parascedosporium putredinis TaxID=1442378 RepID=A0A9P1MCU6_9PEZI|nr:unnamed protein product [Parascedosporium putredinis]CAI7997472.1 unnamed protein product [Parascedosporium putredinis]
MVSRGPESAEVEAHTTEAPTSSSSSTVHDTEASTAQTLASSSSSTTSHLEDSTDTDWDTFNQTLPPWELKDMQCAFRDALMLERLGHGRRIRPKGPVLSIPSAAFIFSQVAYAPARDQDTSGLAMAFLKRYAGPLPEQRWQRWVRLHENIAHVQFHVRYMSTERAPAAWPLEQTQTSGFSLGRSEFTSSESKGPPLIEKRASVVMNTSLGGDDALRYRVLTLADSGALLAEALHDEELWRESTLSIGTVAKGITIFQLFLYQIIKEVSASWTAVLTHSRWDTYDLPREWIEDVRTDMSSLITDCSTTLNGVMGDDDTLVKTNWDVLTNYLNTVAEMIRAHFGAY